MILNPTRFRNDADSLPSLVGAPSPGAFGRGCAPVPKLLWGEDCLSEASSAAHASGTGAKAPGGPRPGANGFGSFCRNKRTSSRGGETPQTPTPSICTARVIQKQAELVQDLRGDFMPPSKFMPGHGESVREEGVLELRRGFVREQGVVRSMTLKHGKPFSAGPSCFPLGSRNDAARQDDEPGKRARASQHCIAGQHGALREPAEEDPIRGKALMPVELVQHGKHSLAGKRQPVGNCLDITRESTGDQRPGPASTKPVHRAGHRPVSGAQRGIRTARRPGPVTSATGRPGHHRVRRTHVAE